MGDENDIDAIRTEQLKRYKDFFLRRDKENTTSITSTIELKPPIFFDNDSLLGAIQDWLFMREHKSLLKPTTKFSRIEIIATLPTNRTCGNLIMNAKTNDGVTNTYLFGKMYTNTDELTGEFDRLSDTIKKGYDKGYVIFDRIHSRQIFT